MKVSSFLEEKRDLHGLANGERRGSSARLVVVAVALAWIFVFVTPSVALLIAVSLNNVELPGVLALGAPMANLGIAVLLALPVMKLLDRVKGSDVLEAAKAGLAAMGRMRSSASAAAGGLAVSIRQGLDDRFEDDERGPDDDA